MRIRVGKTKTYNFFIFLILILAVLTRFFRLSQPPVYIFDEVYHAFTARAYAENDPRGYEWGHQSAVEGTAYEWLHPPLAKLFMALGILVFGNTSFGWRFFSAFFGVLVVYLVFILGKKIFSPGVGLIAAFFICIDGMFLAQSRIAMNDIYLTAFVLLSLYFFWSWWKKEKRASLVLSFFFSGLAVATKWTGAFLGLIFSIFLLKKFFKKKRRFFWLKKNFNFFLALFLLIPFIYCLSYTQFWLQGHRWQDFKELHRQIWWYQTNLKATHDYQSPAFTWPLMLRPVWFWVDYQGDKIANIYNLGNPILWWSGALLLPWFIYGLAKGLKKDENLAFIVIAYFSFWVALMFSPRIMFLHHYLPSLAFLFILLACFWDKIFKWKRKKPLFAGLYLLLAGLTFLFFYPLNTGVAMPRTLLKYLFWLSSWK